MNISADRTTAMERAMNLVKIWVPKVYTSAGYPNIAMADMNDAARDITTGKIDKFRFPVRNSLLSFAFLPRHPKMAPIDADEIRNIAKMK